MQKIVVPGEELADKPLRIDNTIVDNGKTYSTLMALYDDEKKTLTPLEGLWYPRGGDSVIGIIEEDKFNVYTVALDAPYRGLIFSKDVEGDLVAGDIIEATVKELDKTKTAMLARPRRLSGGKILYLKPSKIPRILGKGNTMIRQLSTETQSNIKVGMNGLIWLNGGNMDLATEAILTIQDEAHTSGLTERIKNMLEAGKKV
jgi:exosome complex component RRP4